MKFLAPSNFVNRKSERNERVGRGNGQKRGVEKGLPTPLKINMNAVEGKKYSLRGSAKLGGGRTVVCFGIPGEDSISLLFLLGDEQQAKARLRVNERRRSEKSPHYYGLLRLSDGTRYSLAAWESTSKYGDYLALRVSEYREAREEPEPSPSEIDESIPF